MTDSYANERALSGFTHPVLRYAPATPPKRGFTSDWDTKVLVSRSLNGS
ncbi:MAG: hypothetical protein AAF703_03735 [Cyanobacteria bacterium P01_D01_bin.105]